MVSKNFILVNVEDVASAINLIIKKVISGKYVLKNKKI